MERWSYFRFRVSRSHNLLLLLSKTEMTLNETEMKFLGILMKYQVEGRYPDYNPILPTTIEASTYLNTAERLLKWLMEKL